MTRPTTSRVPPPSAMWIGVIVMIEIIVTLMSTRVPSAKSARRGPGHARGAGRRLLDGRRKGSRGEQRIGSQQSREHDPGQHVGGRRDDERAAQRANVDARPESLGLAPQVRPEHGADRRGHQHRADRSRAPLRRAQVRAGVASQEDRGVADAEADGAHAQQDEAAGPRGDGDHRRSDRRDDEARDQAGPPAGSIHPRRDRRGGEGRRSDSDGRRKPGQLGAAAEVAPEQRDHGDADEEADPGDAPGRRQAPAACGARAARRAAGSMPVPCMADCIPEARPRDYCDRSCSSAP